MMQLRESFKVVFSKQQMMKFENYERMKLRIVHESLIKEEKIPTIYEIIKRNMNDLNEIIQIQKEQVQQEGGHFDL